MPYLILKFLHVGSMFVATALAIGPIAVFVLVLRSGDLAAIRRAFRYAEGVSRAGGVAYGLAVIFGIVTALNGGIDLSASWLVIAYGLLAALIMTNLYADRWLKAVARAAEASSNAPSPELMRWVRARSPAWSLAAAGTITLAIVFVMVVKPTFW